MSDWLIQALRTLKGFSKFSTGDVGYIVVVEYNAAFKRRREWGRADEMTDLYHHF